MSSRYVGFPVTGSNALITPGPDAHAAACRLVGHEGPLAPRYATFTVVRPRTAGRSREPIDHVLATYFPAPHSYTGDDVVELSAHGSPVVLHAIQRLDPTHEAPSIAPSLPGSSVH